MPRWARIWRTFQQFPECCELYRRMPLGTPVAVEDFPGLRHRRLARDAVELLEVERHAVELDRTRRDDRVRRPRVEAEVVVGLAVVVADPDASGVHVPGLADAAELR